MARSFLGGGYVSGMFTAIGVDYNRFDIGAGAGMSIINGGASQVPAMKTLPIYSGQSTDGDGNGVGCTPTSVTADITALIPQLKAAGITVLEFFNESYQSISAATYAAMYHAAHVLTKPAGITLLCVAGVNDNFGSGNWYASLAAHFPAAQQKLTRSRSTPTHRRATCSRHK